MIAIILNVERSTIKVHNYICSIIYESKKYSHIPSIVRYKFLGASVAMIAGYPYEKILLFLFSCYRPKRASIVS